jgi:hypothetical protein
MTNYLHTTAPITNFKNVNKLKIKAKSKNRQVSSLNKRRKFTIKNPLEGNGFLDRIQNMSPEKKMALNLKIKEKMLAPISVKHKDATNPSIKSSLHLKTKSDVPCYNELSNENKMYASKSKDKLEHKSK